MTCRKRREIRIVLKPAGIATSEIRESVNTSSSRAFFSRALASSSLNEAAIVLRTREDRQLGETHSSRAASSMEKFATRLNERGQFIKEV